MEKSILVAGGTGLVGANLAIALKKENFPMVCTRYKNKSNEFYQYPMYNFEDYKQCLAATKGKAAVVLCAAKVYGVQQNQTNKTNAILPNLKINLGLLEACAQNKVQTVILISSTTLYQPAFFPLSESELDLNTAPFSSYFGVGWTNRFLEKMAELYSTTYGMRAIVFRPTSLYGPYDRFTEHNSHVIPALIRRAVNKEDPFIVWGSPHVVRDFIYIGDFIEDIVYALTQQDIPANSPINICSGSPITIGDAVNIILSKTEHTPKIDFDYSKPSAIPYRTVDNTKYRAYFGNTERTPFDSGIEKTIQWYRMQIASERKK